MGESTEGALHHPQTITFWCLSASLFLLISSSRLLLDSVIAYTLSFPQERTSLFELPKNAGWWLKCQRHEPVKTKKKSKHRKTRNQERWKTWWHLGTSHLYFPGQSLPAPHVPTLLKPHVALTFCNRSSKWLSDEGSYTCDYRTAPLQVGAEKGCLVPQKELGLDLSSATGQLHELVGI